jgi:hypothetical protein
VGSIGAAVGGILGGVIGNNVDVQKKTGGREVVGGSWGNRKRAGSGWGPLFFVGKRRNVAAGYGRRLRTDGWLAAGGGAHG